MCLMRASKTIFSDTYNRETLFIPNGDLPANIVDTDEITKLFGICKDE